MFCFQIYVIWVFNGFFNRRFYQKLMTQTNQNWQQTWETYKLFKLQISSKLVENCGLECAIYGFWQVLTVIFNGNNGQINKPCTYSGSACQNLQESVFCFWFHVTWFLTVFPTVILTGSWWRRKLKCNPKPSHAFGYSNHKFQENRIKTVAVTVPSWLMEHMTVVTSSNMQMS